MSASMPDIGLCFHREFPAVDVVTQARAAEAAGYDEFWVIEDCFFTSAPSLAAVSLTATSSVKVGIGIMPVVARNVAITAMEIATLCGLGPGRFHAGLGHGMPEWMDQIGERVDSPVGALAETFDAVRRLLRGEEVSVEGQYVQLRGVRLAAPPSAVPLVSAGVRGPVSLRAAGRCADGVILADFCSPTYVRAVRSILASSGGDGSQRVTVFASMAVGRDGDAMRRAMAQAAAGPFAAGFPSVTGLPFFDEVSIRAERVGWAAALAAMPRDWWVQIGAIGTPDDAAEYLSTMAAAGADCVALFPDPVDPVGSACALAVEVFPLLG